MTLRRLEPLQSSRIVEMPRLELVVAIEEGVAGRIIASTYEDEQRLRFYLASADARRRIVRGVMDFLDGLEERAA